MFGVSEKEIMGHMDSACIPYASEKKTFCTLTSKYQRAVTI